MKTSTNSTFNRLTFVLLIALSPLMGSAAETQRSGSSGYMSNPLFLTLLVVIIMLAVIVMSLSRALKNIISSDMFLEKIKKEKSPAAGKTALILLALSFAGEAMAGTPATAAAGRIGGLDQLTFYVMIGLIAAELLTIAFLLNTFKNILGNGKKTVAAVKPAGKTIFDRLNDTVELEEEGTIMLEHDYDGIRELDNNLPPWWKYGFYLTILIAVLYMVNYHVTKTAPLQAEEYQLSLKKAEAEIAEYMKTSANNVDETTVKLLTEPADIAAGKDIFLSTCAACHGRNGEGSVGPNLTDDYWLHSGGVSDIFKTIKYGWPDKGMKSWKEDYSPIQIAQLTSFIKSLRGTNPANAKAKEGELYNEKNLVPSDSTAAPKDSTTVMAAQLGN